MTGEKRLKDPIYGYISIPTRLAKNIVDNAAFQRLRRITQTSYSPLYASSIHNRFIHSLGVFHLGKMAINTIVAQVREKEFIIEDLDEKAEIFLLACLLHDVGHAPFSHTGEKFYLEDTVNNKYRVLHDKLSKLVGSDEFSKDIPSNESQAAAPHEVMSAITALVVFEDFFPTPFYKELFARCITGYTYSESTSENSFLNCLISLLNSKVIDVDRLDYLIRDAFFTGFDTIVIDYERLLTSLTIVKSLTESSEDESDDIEKYEIAFQKNAISVIENVVYAHDAERKWIQNHPIVLYEIYIIQHVMAMLNSEIKEGKNRLFSLDALGTTGICFLENIRISLLCDDDIIFLMKSRADDSLSREYFNRNIRRHPLWKSEAEYRAYLSQMIGEGDILNRLENALIETEKYVRKNSDSWVINDALINKLDLEISKLEGDEGKELSSSTRKRQLTTKNSIKKVFKSLKNYAEKNGNACDFVILSASQFYSSFNRPDVTNINIAFNTPAGVKISKFGKIVSLLNGDRKWRDNFFYIYYKENTQREINKEKFFRTLIEEFVKI